MEPDSLYKIGFAKSKTAPLVEVTYSELADLRDNGALIPGVKYCITDFVTTIKNNSYNPDGGDMFITSAQHPYNIIVTAVDDLTFSADAEARLCADDDYFDGIEDPASWKLKYEFDGTKGIYSSYYGANTKGYVYEMTDSRGNSAPYDFKNLLFGGKYTFNGIDSGELEDATMNSVYKIADNKIIGGIHSYLAMPWIPCITIDVGGSVGHNYIVGNTFRNIHGADISGGIDFFSGNVVVGSSYESHLRIVWNGGSLSDVVLKHNVFSLETTAYIDITGYNASIMHCKIKGGCHLTVSKFMDGIVLEATRNPISTAADFPIRDNRICPNIEISCDGNSSKLFMTYLDTDSGLAYSIGTWDSPNNRYSWSPVINPLT